MNRTTTLNQCIQQDTNFSNEINKFNKRISNVNNIKFSNNQTDNSSAQKSPSQSEII